MTMNRVNGGEAAAAVMKANGVGSVFGLLGGSMLELYDAIHADGSIRYIGARDERAAAHMADAYARVSGGVGVVLLFVNRTVDELHVVLLKSRAIEVSGSYIDEIFFVLASRRHWNVKSL